MHTSRYVYIEMIPRMERNDLDAHQLHLQDELWSDMVESDFLA